MIRRLVGLVAACLVQEGASTMLGHFFTGVPNFNGSAAISTEPGHDLSWLNGHQHYRLIPGGFPDGIDYHFDGLAMVLHFSFADGDVSFKGKAFESKAYKEWSKCIFVASGSGPTLGIEPCLENPVVNILPLNGQLWLTIDTSMWGRMDPVTLETIETAKTDVHTTVLNAHPACDRSTNQCFVEHPCPASEIPDSKIVCISELVTDLNGTGNMGINQLTQASMPKNMLIQHSHSPCVTPNYVVSKLDSFGFHKNKDSKDKGMLKLLHQVEDNLWLVMHREDNSSRIMTSNFSFVNNHFWNCYETDEGVVVDSVTATDDYLAIYYRDHLEKGTTNWTNIFYPPIRCVVPHSGTAIGCGTLLLEESTRFDYPTFNPLWKMNPNYKWFYAISPSSTTTSQWFDRLVKVSSVERLVSAEWSSPGVYLTEADFIPRPQGTAEDDGVLVSILYNSTANSSSFAIFNATDLKLLVQTPMGGHVVPFHAHGISCPPASVGGCYTNP